MDEVMVFLDTSDIPDEAERYALGEDGSVVLQPPKPGRRPFDGWAKYTRQTTAMERLKYLLRQHSLTVAVIDRLRERIRLGRVPPPDENGTDSLGPWRNVLKIEQGNWTHDAAAYALLGESGLARANQSMELLSNLVHKHGIPLTIVVCPWPNQIAAGDRDSKQVRHWRAWAAAHRSGFIDLFPEFFDNPDPTASIPAYYIARDTHFNAAGHRPVAAAVLRQHRWAAKP